ncbi:carbon-nitrogen hydrolase family protein [Mesorhizobium sp. BR1-1-3]|uniref:carbon-nitrogen hydrolase family protein n=1 Tax=Mesorhizobium sp. BR1-1-3 TaxID=2876651 RepID=UPI001CD18B29|nr:carbon-nitrogen hydrolase family protein [Mesorhizobium sp. BR1-1-3]MBZ9891502.1 carbon-nitrogen hydrolase family protein [Mesorhizobium sp. BR1-1-3]
MRIGFVEWPDGLQPRGSLWTDIARRVRSERPDLLITNELPFGNWIASGSRFSAVIATASIALHDQGLAALSALEVPTVLTSRPIWEEDRLANEAVVIEDGQIRAIHRKQYFPAEPGWHETEWYATAARDFTTTQVGGVMAGVLLCTEAMFNEHARAYGRNGASLIALPRATGPDYRSWQIAGAMAALVSGCYVVSSNRSGRLGHQGPLFGGRGFAFAPGGRLLATTSSDRPIVTIELDAARSSRAQADYPCYVTEPARQ